MLLFFTWKASGADPYRVYNNLGEDYRALSDPTSEPRPPQFPERVRAFVYACGLYAREIEKDDLRKQAQMIARAMGG